MTAKLSEADTKLRDRRVKQQQYDSKRRRRMEEMLTTTRAKYKQLVKEAHGYGLIHLLTDEEWKSVEPSK